MNKIVIVLYMGILFCLTCTESLHELVGHQALTFEWTENRGTDLKNNYNFNKESERDGLPHENAEVRPSFLLCWYNVW